MQRGVFLELSYALILILLPGLVAFGVAKVFSGNRARPVNEVIAELVIQSVVVLLIYAAISQFDFLALPRPSEIGLAILRIKRETNLESVKPSIELFTRAIIVSILLAIFSGFASALMSEAKVVKRLGRKLWVFQSDAEDTAWKTTFSSGSQECWVHIDTKGGKRYVGLSHSVSWSPNEGGIGLKDVRLFDPVDGSLFPVADYLYVSTAELDGPILFVRGSTPNTQEKT